MVPGLPQSLVRRPGQGLRSLYWWWCLSRLWTFTMIWLFFCGELENYTCWNLSIWHWFVWCFIRSGWFLFSWLACLCLCLSVCLPVWLTVCLFVCVCPSVCLSVYVCLFVFVHLSVGDCMSACLSVYPVYTCLSVCLCLSVSIHPSVRLSACLALSEANSQSVGSHVILSVQ